MENPETQTTKPEQTANMIGDTFSAAFKNIDLPYITGRAKAILQDPNAAWESISADGESITDVYRRFVIPLAAITPVCQLLGNILYGRGMGVLSSLIFAVVQYALSLGILYVIAMILEFLSKSFEGNSSRPGAFKLAAYASTANYLGGIFTLVPFVGWLASMALAFYSVYIYFLGIPRMLSVPQSKQLVFFLVSGVTVVIVMFVAGSIAMAPFVANQVVQNIH